MQTPNASLDTLLDIYCRAPDGEAERHLEALMAQAENIFRPILRDKLRLSTARPGSPEALAGEDVRGELVLNLVTRLRRAREAPETERIGDLRAFVAVSAYRACGEHFRRKYPQRASLRNKLYSLLTRSTYQHGLALWDCEGKRLCGFTQWRGQSGDRAPKCLRLMNSSEDFVREELKNEEPSQMSPARLLAKLFDWVGAPVELDDLVAIVAELWAIRDQPEAAPAFVPEGRLGDPLERLADTRADVAREVDQRESVMRLWTEIRQLPPRQAAALLLNLRDSEGRGVVALLSILGIATLREIAAAMEIPVERFAEMWNGLPLGDLAIAELLGCTRQQVINLRKVARERLARRIRTQEAAV